MFVVTRNKFSKCTDSSDPDQGYTILGVFSTLAEVKNAVEKDCKALFAQLPIWSNGTGQSQIRDNATFAQHYGLASNVQWWWTKHQNEQGIESPKGRKTVRVLMAIEMSIYDENPLQIAATKAGEYWLPADKHFCHEHTDIIEIKAID